MKSKRFTKETINELGMLKRAFPRFEVGDMIAVHQRIAEGDKERIQIFEGDVIGMHQNGASSTFVVRKIGAHGVAVERIFPYHSPVIKDIQVLKHGRVRRAKLNYLRDREGSSARVEEKILTREQKENKAAQHTATEEAGS